MTTVWRVWVFAVLTGRFRLKLTYIDLPPAPCYSLFRYHVRSWGCGFPSYHNEVVEKHNAVWFGKLGGTLSLARIEMLNKQVEKKTPTFLYLVKGNRRKSTPYKARILEVSRDFPNKEKALIPTCYAEKKLLKFMNAWVKVGRIEQVEMTDLKNLKTINSIFPIEEMPMRSSSGHFFVHESKFIF